jgi:hypothetical protein
MESGNMENDDEKAPDPEELAAAEAFAKGLEGGPGGDPEDLAAAGMIRAAAGKPPRLGDVASRAIARQALAGASARAKAPARPRRARFLAAGAIAFAAACAVALLARPLLDGGGPLPQRLQSRTAGMLVPGPFPPDQTAAQRLDLVAADRLVAFREVARYARAGGRR